MARIHRLKINPPILNSSSLWASSFDELKELYTCRFTGAVTTRTATMSGFLEDPAIHKYALLENDTSINSFGYSPHPLSRYLTWIRALFDGGDTSSIASKPIIISLAPASTAELSSMLDIVQELRRDVMDFIDPAFSRIGIELNTSCPNILGQPPPAYDLASLLPLLHVFRQRFGMDHTLTIGLKLAPFVHSGQFQQVIEVLASLTTEGPGLGRSNCISFLTCTNTLGSSLVFREQATTNTGDISMPYVLPTATGGLAGGSIHALSLGNVYSFRKLLDEHPDPSLKKIAIIGVGGVSSPGAVKRMFHAGATAVACATALGAHGVGVFDQLSEGLIGV